MEISPSNSFEGEFWELPSDRSFDPSVMVLKNRHELCEDLKYIISVSDMCDVTFLVGPQKAPINGIRAILATRSRIMYQIILNKQNEDKKNRRDISVMRRGVNKIRKAFSRKKISKQDKLTIEMKDFDVQVFESLIRYIHCGVVSVNPSTVVGLINAARMFEFPELHAACWEFAMQCLRPDSLPLMIEAATYYSQFKETRQLMQKILSYLGETPDVIHCCPEVQQLIPVRPDENMC